MASSGKKQPISDILHEPTNKTENTSNKSTFQNSSGANNATQDRQPTETATETASSSDSQIRPDTKTEQTLDLSTRASNPLNRIVPHCRGQTRGMTPMGRFLAEGPSHQNALFIRADTGRLSTSRVCDCRYLKQNQKDKA